ncbi:alpha/beta hydrolase [Bradyrhizobium sp. SSBR45R]|nr:alpha/beta hydrolase [Bradyrhizobium sp. SSBR45R]
MTFTLDRRQVLAAAAAGSVASATAVHAKTSAAGPRKTNNVVLVHGAFADGSSWSEVAARLLAKGYNVSAVQNPLTSLADDVAATKRVLSRQQGAVVLVGHSWGGAVISEAGAVANVSALVYVSALAPDAGEAVMDLQSHGPASPGMQGAKPDNGLLWFDPAAYRDALAADLPVRRTRVLAAVQQPIAPSCFGEKLSAAAWHDKPSWYLLSENDKALSPELQRWMAARIKAKIKAVPSSHLSLISRAEDVVELIDQAANA